MKKILLLAVLLAGMVGCSCGLERKAIDQLESNVKRQMVDHVHLMNKVGRVPEEQQDWARHYDATLHLIDALKKAAK